MTGHLLVPALDPDRLSTVSPAITTDLLRGRLGFRGTVVTDALEMRAVAGTIGIVAGFVQALVAGADAIETGAQDHPELVDEIPAAVQRALDDGVLTLERLRDAAARTAALATSAGSTVDAPDVRGLAARCVEVIGELPPLVRPLVIEARPPGGMASGHLPWSLGEPLAELIEDTEVAQVDASTDFAALAAQTPGRMPVIVVRDPNRHPWQQQLLRCPAAVIVDVGWPADVPAGVPVLRTRGVAPGLLAAAADRLAGRVPAVLA
jgi:beta-N-acetylhexosaminidase